MIPDLLRDLGPGVVRILVSRNGQREQCEDAVQEALLAASDDWVRNGIPQDPRAWLVVVAQRRLVDAWRSESARRAREQAVFDLERAESSAAGAHDDTLDLLVLCCHPSLSPASQVALTLRAVGGLTTAEIARAFLVPEATMAQRISRAKATIAAAGAHFGDPVLAGRLDAVRHVVYLIFNEGYTATRTPIAEEAIRIARMLANSTPHDPETLGLLALLLLTDARRPARERDGELIPLAEQDRGLWDRDRVDEGVELLQQALRVRRPGPYQLQAAIAAVHDEAASDAETDWPQIAALYEVLAGIAPSPVVTLNRAVAVARVEGPAAGLALLDGLDLPSHRVDAVRAHLLEEAGDRPGARDAYLRAARATASVQEQRHLNLRAAMLAE